MMSRCKDSRDIEVHCCMADEEIWEQGLRPDETIRQKNLWVMLVAVITDHTTGMTVFSHKGPAAAWRALEGKRCWSRV